jgi:hypothetical protein
VPSVNLDPDKLDDDALDALHEELASMVRRHASGEGAGSAGGTSDAGEQGDDSSPAEAPTSSDATSDERDAPVSGQQLALGDRGLRVLPLEEPSEGLEQRILEATAFAQRGAPWHRKVVRVLAWAGSHAMRPQLAMAAVFVLVVGSSLLLVRAKPGTGGSPLQVTERGVPAPEGIVGEDIAATAAPAAAAPEPIDDERARRAAKSESEEASKEADSAQAKATESDKSGAAALLAEARAARDDSGCSAAVGRYDQVGVAYPGTKEASLAMWEAANCYKSMGQDSKAVELWLALRADEGYRDQADAEIAAVEGSVQNLASAPGAGAGVASPPKAAAKQKAPAEMPAPAPPPPAQGGASDAPAAPDRSFDNAF